MSQFLDGPVKAFTAGAAIAQHLRVKLTAGKLAAAGANDQDIGTMAEASFADLDVRSVWLANGDGTRKMVAAAAITAGAKVYGAAGGKVSSTVSSVFVGYALGAATADGDVIEVLRLGAGGGSGLKAVYGQHTTVAASDTVVTGLTTVVAVVAQLDSDPVDGAMHVTSSIGDQAGAPAAGSILIKSWKSTDGDATLIAGTTFGLKVNYIAIGT